MSFSTPWIDRRLGAFPPEPFLRQEVLPVLVLKLADKEDMGWKKGNEEIDESTNCIASFPSTLTDFMSH